MPLMLFELKCEGCQQSAERLTSMFGQRLCDTCVEAVNTVPGNELNRRKGKGNTHARQKRGK